MRILIIAGDRLAMDSVQKGLGERGNHVEAVQSAIEGNDVILAGLATGNPYQLIILHHDQDSSDTRELIRYWRNQDPFLPLVYISAEPAEPAADLQELGLLDCIPEQAPLRVIQNRVDLIGHSMAKGATYRLKAEILDRPAMAREPAKAIHQALDLISETLPVRAVAFVTYSDVEGEPILQITKDTEVYDQVWLDEWCQTPERTIEPILQSNRMSFDPADPPRYLFPIHSSRGWEGVLVFFEYEDQEPQLNTVRSGRFSTIADGISLMLEHVRAREALASAQSTKTEYMAILSQRIGEPIANLTSTSELLLMVDCDAGVKNLTTKMAHNARMAKELLEDIIELARIDDGMLVIHPVGVSMKKLLAKLVRRLDVMFKEKELTIQIHADPDEEYTVEGDPEKLTRVFTNLLTNAARFSPNDSPIDLHFHAEEDGWVRVSITDQGPGLLPDQLQDIFRRHQTDQHQAVSEHGVGLYLCRKFIIAHEGQIWAESQYGLGATFHVRLRPGIAAQRQSD